MPAPLLRTSDHRYGRWRDHPQLINGITHRLGTGCQWRKPPERIGLWQTARRRHQLRSADGTWERLLQHVRSLAEVAGDGDGAWSVNVDSTSIRARQLAPAATKAEPLVPPASSKEAETKAS